MERFSDLVRSNLGVRFVVLMSLAVLALPPLLVFLGVCMPVVLTRALIDRFYITRNDPNDASETHDNSGRFFREHPWQAVGVLFLTLYLVAASIVQLFGAATTDEICYSTRVGYACFGWANDPGFFVFLVFLYHCVFWISAGGFAFVVLSATENAEETTK